MEVKLLVSLHIFAALCLCLASVFNLLTHPLNGRNAIITIVLLCFGCFLLIQELSILVSRHPPRKSSFLDTYRVRAMCFLVAAALVFDRLLGLPCDTEATPSPLATASAKLTISPGRAAAKSSTKPSLSDDRPPTFGTAFYMSNSLSPTCVRIDAVPSQDIDSVAWVSVSVNRVSRALVFTASAFLLFISLVYFVLWVLHASEKVGVSPSMSSGHKLDDFDDPQDLEARPTTFHEAPKDREGTCSAAYHLHSYADDRTFRSRSVDLFEENALDMADEIQCASVVTPLSENMSGKPPSIASSHRLGRTSANLAPGCVLNATQGAASTPEQVLRNQPKKVMLAPLRAGSDPYLAASVPREQAAAGQSPQRYGYGYGYGCDYGYHRTADLSSGCIMHYPLFAPKKKKSSAGSASKFATLSPPDFSRSRSTTSSSLALTPRLRGKGRARGSSKKSSASASEAQRETDAQVRDAVKASAGAEHGLASIGALPAVTKDSNEVAQADVEEPNGTEPRLTSESAISESRDKRYQSTAEADRAASETIASPRLGTSDSALSALTTLAVSRPGTNHSTHSTRHRRGLFARLELNRIHSRLSAISLDVPRDSCDSQRSCSAGTFGDGVTGDEPATTTTPTPRWPDA